jgi:hypothetical protein
MKSSKAKSSEAAASASSALVGVHSLSSLEPELITIDYQDLYGRKAVTRQNVKVLNYSGTMCSDPGTRRLAEELGKMTALQQLNIECTV